MQSHNPENWRLRFAPARRTRRAGADVVVAQLEMQGVQMIRVQGLTRTYADLTAVDQVSFEIDQGEIVGLLGHNGAGKTTIMKMLTGFLEPTAGEIEIDGMDIRSQRQAIQRRIGYLPENCPVYPEMAVVDYLDYAAAMHGVAERERLDRVREAIDRTELGPKAGDPIQNLSRGYRQRVGVAQAILHRPSILILDEPTNGLDPTQIHQMRGLIRNLSESATVIVSTHILQEVQAVCGRVIIMRDGHKALDERLDELQAGSRLLVTVGSAPEQARPVLAGVAGVASVEPLAGEAGRYRFALNVTGEGDPSAAAPGLVRALTEAGIDLYGLGTERRDLESIFGEISAAGGWVQ
jgi:ABC-2 type transport system ATP-binding protein